MFVSNIRFLCVKELICGAYLKVHTSKFSDYKIGYKAWFSYYWYLFW